MGKIAAFVAPAVLSACLASGLVAQEESSGTPMTVEFPSADGLLITADVYERDRSLPTLVLFHQSASSRGEFSAIAPRIAGLGFNVMAVDLRWGHRRQGVANETAVRWGTPEIMERVENDGASPWPTIFASYDDMLAAYDWLTKEDFVGPRWVLGSSVSAMLVFRLAAERPVDAVLAYSPAEYFDADTLWVRRHADSVQSALYLVAAPGEEEDVGAIHEHVTTGRTRRASPARLSTGGLPIVRFFQAPAGRHGASILDADTRNVDDLMAFLSEVWGGLPDREEYQATTEEGEPLILDVYEPRSENGSLQPVILLLHQGGGSGRGEYGFLIPELTRRGFPLVIPDLPGGGDRFGFPNRTIAARSESAEDEAPSSYCAAEVDIAAARAFARRRWPQRRQILWGSSYSAALAIRSAAFAPAGVEAVLAFSPASGEPMTGCTPEDAVARLAAPTLVVRPRREAEIPEIRARLHLFESAGLDTYVADPGSHGSSTLHPYRVRGDVAAVRRRVFDFIE